MKRGSFGAGDRHQPDEAIDLAFAYPRRQNDRRKVLKVSSIEPFKRPRLADHESPARDVEKEDAGPGSIELSAYPLNGLYCLLAEVIERLKEESIIASNYLQLPRGCTRARLVLEIGNEN